jgi:hypothetical protein
LSITFKSLQKSDEKLLILLVGKPSAGKTTCSLSMSLKFDPTFKSPQVLDDIAVLTCEPDALKGPKLLGVEVPYWLDLTDYTTDGKTFDDALNSSLKMVHELAKAKKIRGVVFDTASTLDKTWKAYLSKQYEKWALVDQLLIRHRRLIVEQLLPMSVPVIMNMHLRKVGEMDNSKRESLGLDMDDQLIMDISGWDAPGLYRALASYILPIKKTEVKGKPDEFHLYPRGVGGIENKGRYGIDGPPDKMAANMNQFLNIIKSAQAA